MRIKCVCNDNGECDLTIGKIYEVQEETYNKFYIKNDFGLTWGYLKKRFEIVEEDKMKEVRIVRKLEDLDGLENGMGLRLVFKEFVEAIAIYFGKELKYTTADLDFIKAMGFKFEYKPLRSKEEILSCMAANAKKYGCESDFVVSLTKEYNYSAITLGNREIIGKCYFREDVALAYAKELNEIIGVGK